MACPVRAKDFQVLPRKVLDLERKEQVAAVQAPTPCFPGVVRAQNKHPPRLRADVRSSSSASGRDAERQAMAELAHQARQKQRRAPLARAAPDRQGHLDWYGSPVPAERQVALRL